MIYGVKLRILTNTTPKIVLHNFLQEPTEELIHNKVQEQYGDCEYEVLDTYFTQDQKQEYVFDYDDFVPYKYQLKNDKLWVVYISKDAMLLDVIRDTFYNDKGAYDKMVSIVKSFGGEVDCKSADKRFRKEYLKLNW